MRSCTSNSIVSHVAPARWIAFATLLLISGCIACTRTLAAELPRCVESPEGERGSGVVTGFPGERLYVSPKHPRECSATGINACPGRAYLLIGDEVQTLGTCDGWTHVRYSGARSTTGGWVASRRLNGGSTEYNIPYFYIDAELERPRKAPEAGVCEAALKGAVDDAGLRDVTRHSFQRELMSKGFDDYLPEFAEVIAEGNVDLLNEGRPRRVALLSADYLVHNAAFHTEWLVVLDADGLPDPTVPTQHQLFESVGTSDHVRLFKLRGVTYLEHEPATETADSGHEIWRFSNSQGVKVCDYTTAGNQK